MVSGVVFIVLFGIVIGRGCAIVFVLFCGTVYGIVCVKVCGILFLYLVVHC